ncbi:predicted protein [Nematostella vectensis]|uniref:N-acetyltransferase domain-containing protein n=1 Tax=Nematostella vectensis TaxID=45351 RepID=A7RI58_NEMVE|nr:predicted protein [Nematostella vectensis]|eukprot:XP_001641035.1 predicted protein [Nematostella vectensis]
MSQGIYSGHDYLPCIFIEWLNQPSRLIFVAEVGGKLVGLRAINIIDDGKTFISQGLRIHPDFRGLGLSSRLIAEVHDYIRKKYPSVVRERFTTKSDNIERLAIQKKQGDRAVLDQDILAYHIPKNFLGNISEHSTVQSSIKLHPYSKQDTEVILRESVANTLFQDNTLIIDWEPFEALRSNIDCIFQEWDCLFADRSASECRDGKWPKSFSHGRRSERVDCVHWVATIYTDDPVLFTAHVLRQLKAACGITRDKFVFSTFHRPDMTEHGKQLLTAGLSLQPVEFFTFGLRLFEKEFN